MSLPLWADLAAWQYALHTVTSILTLLLIALLENAGRRAEEAAQEKLNVIAEALAALMESRAIEDPDLEEAHERLSDAGRPRGASLVRRGAGSRPRCGSAASTLAPPASARNAACSSARGALVERRDEAHRAEAVDEPVAVEPLLVVERPRRRPARTASLASSARAPVARSRAPARRRGSGASSSSMRRWIASSIRRRLKTSASTPPGRSTRWISASARGPSNQ